MFRLTKIFTLLLSLMLLLSGCNDIHLNAYTTLNKDGTGDFKFQVSYDEFIGKYLSDSLFSDEALSQLKAYGVTSNKYLKNKLIYEELTYPIAPSHRDLKLIPDNSLCATELRKKVGLESDVYTLTITFQDALLDALMPLINDVAVETLSSNTSTLPNASPLDYLKSLSITSYITVPGEVISSNAIETIDQDTLSWSYKLGQIGTNTQMTVTYELSHPNRLNTALLSSLIVVLVALLVGILYAIKTRRSTLK